MALVIEHIGSRKKGLFGKSQDYLSFSSPQPKVLENWIQSLTQRRPHSELKNGWMEFEKRIGHDLIGISRQIVESGGSVEQPVVNEVTKENLEYGSQWVSKATLTQLLIDVFSALSEPHKRSYITVYFGYKALTASAKGGESADSDRLTDALVEVATRKFAEIFIDDFDAAIEDVGATLKKSEPVDVDAFRAAISFVDNCGVAHKSFIEECMIKHIITQAISRQIIEIMLTVCLQDGDLSQEELDVLSTCTIQFGLETEYVKERLGVILDR